MKIRKNLIRVVIMSLCILLLGTFVISAASTPYATYTYTIDGDTRTSPAAYVPDRSINNYDMNMETPLKNAKDIFYGPDEKIYIADAGNSRIVVLNKSSIYQYEISEFDNENGVPDKLNECEGVFVTTKNIFVCDTKNARIVVFDIEGNFDHIIYAPTADVMGSDTLFRPVAMAVDVSGRMYVVSKSTYSGVFAFNDDGTFQGFVGVQKTSVPLSVRIRKFFFPNTISETYNSVEFNNIEIDENGFVWVTTNGIDETTLENAILSNDTDYAPVKQLNPEGDDIMRRNGFFMPAGEIKFNGKAAGSNNIYGPSSIIDVALGPNGSWSIIDNKRSRIYTYDRDGQLLYAFGDIGSQLGNLKDPSSMIYIDNDIYVLDATTNTITVYKRTEYGDAIAQALVDNINRDYTAALNDWNEIIKRNNNFDAAYVGIADNLYLKGEYREAMVYYKAATDTEGYSKCFAELRKAWFEKYFILVVILIGGALFGLTKLLRFINKKNKAATTKGGKRTFGEEYLFGFHLIAHPFDGFWDLKHEKRGSIRGALLHLGIVTLAVIYKNVGTAYIFSPNVRSDAIFSGLATVLVPFILWCVANWCITTLFDGEGNFKDIFIASAYALIPIAIILIPTTIFSNVALAGESSIITLLDTIAYIWTGLLIFFGTMTIHGYSMGKNIIATFGTILGMAFILFLVILFGNLIRSMASFISDIITEIAYRAR